MTDMREILRRALPESAPMPITRESAVTAGRRAARFHRARIGVVAVGAATAIVLAGGGLLGGARAASTAGAPEVTATPGPPATPSAPAATPSGGPAVTPSGTPAVTPSTAPAASPVRPPVNRRLTEPAAQATARLTTALRAAAHPRLPPSDLHPVTVLWTSGTRTHRPLEAFRIESVYMGLAEVRDARGTGSVDFHLNPYLGENPKRPFANFCAVVMPPLVSCETRVGPRGELITVEIGHPSTSSPVTEYRVDVVKADGTALVCVARNVGDTADLNTGPVERPDPPLTVDEMIEILLHPGLTLYP